MSDRDLSSMRRSKLRFSDSFASLLFGGAVLIVLFAFFYVERNRTGVAPERPASKEFLRAGSPGFEQYRRLIDVEWLEATQTSQAPGATVMELTATLRNSTGRTVNELEVRGVVFGETAEPLDTPPTPDRLRR